MGDRFVLCAQDRVRDVLRPGGLLDPDRVVAGQTRQAAGQERLERDVPPVLLADEHDEWGTVDPCRRQRADRVAQSRSRVEDRKRRRIPAEGETGRHADHRRLVEREDETEVPGEPGEEWDLRRPGVREQRRQPALANEVEEHVTQGRGAHGHARH
jgi:hypothetical protein